ncbi:unnamed protein product [Urochloa humidicola]
MSAPCNHRKHGAAMVAAGGSPAAHASREPSIKGSPEEIHPLRSPCFPTKGTYVCPTRQCQNQVSGGSYSVLQMLKAQGHSSTSPD